MPTVSDTRYFEHTAVDTKVTNKALGGTTLSPFVVPPGMNYIIGFIPQYSGDGAVVSSSGGIAELSGDGLVNTRTPIQIPMGGFGATLATTHSTPSRAGYIPTNIPCVDGADIDAVSNMVGVDTGTSVSSLELEYSSVKRPGYPIIETYKALEVIAAAVDTWTEMEEGGSAKKFKPAVADRFIRQLITVAAGDAAGTGGASTALRFTGQGIDQDQIWTLDGWGGTHATEANGHAEARYRTIEAKVNGNQPITAEVMMSGVDAGAVLAIVGIGLTK